MHKNHKRRPGKAFPRILRIFCCLLLLTVVSASCSPPRLSEEKQKESEFVQEKLDILMEHSASLVTTDGWSNVMGLSLYNGKESVPYANIVSLDNESDSLYLVINFAGGEKADYILKIFVDYQETEFQIDQDVYQEYYFDAEATDGFSLEFHLPEDKINLEQNHTVTFMVFRDPQTHGNPRSLERDALSIDYTLVSAQAQPEQKQEISYNQPASFYDIPFSGIMLNCETELKNTDRVFYPPAVLDANPGKTVTMTYYAGGAEDSDSMLFLLLVDWKQVDINGSPYLITKNQYPDVNCGQITFKAPDTPGQYEVVALMSEYPFEWRNENNSSANETSTRFTLNVTDPS